MSMNLSHAERQPLLGRPQRVFQAFTGHNDASHVDDPEYSNVENLRKRLRHFLTSRLGHYAILLLVSLDVSCIFADFLITIYTCSHPHGNPNANEALDILGIFSLVFSSLFVLELLISLFAFGLSYFKSKFHFFDAVIIIAGFIVDVLLRGTAEEAASLIIVLRLWRVVKIIEEMSVGAQEQMEGLEDRISELERENSSLREQLKKSHGGREA